MICNKEPICHVDVIIAAWQMLHAFSGKEDSPIAPSSSECFFHHQPAQDPCGASMTATPAYHGRCPTDRSFRLLRRLPGEQPICIAFFPLEPHFPPVQNPGIVPFPRFIQPFPLYSHATAFCQGHAEFLAESCDIRLSWHGGAMGLSLSRARQVASQPCDIAAPSIAFSFSRNCPSGSHVRRPEREADFESGRSPKGGY